MRIQAYAARICCGSNRESLIWQPTHTSKYSYLRCDWVCNLIGLKGEVAQVWHTSSCIVLNESKLTMNHISFIHPKTATPKSWNFNTRKDQASKWAWFCLECPADVVCKVWASQGIQGDARPLLCCYKSKWSWKMGEHSKYLLDSIHNIHHHALYWMRVN